MALIFRKNGYFKKTEIQGVLMFKKRKKKVRQRRKKRSIYFNYFLSSYLLRYIKNKKNICFNSLSSSYSLIKKYIKDMFKNMF